MMWRWFRRLRDAWQFAKAAEKKRELLGEPPIATRVAGMALMDGLLNRQSVCTRCFSRYTPQEYEFAERFQVRSILMIPDSAPDPMLCDACFQSVSQEINRKWTNIGTSNAGPPNLLLRRSVENPH